MLLGRERELVAAVEVCRAVAAGRGSVLVIVGEPGIGKTTLLAAAVTAEPDWEVLRATGVEAESEVAFATLQALLWPLRDGLGELEAGQERLLTGVLDLGPARGATSFTVGAATLALLSVSSRERPVIVAVDDAQWADVASQEVLCFVGRRLEHESVALVAGVREGEACLLAEERSFGQLRLQGLPGDLARELLERSASGELDAEVAERLVSACAGNPLGLVELPLLLSDAQRRGGDPLPAAFEAGPLVRRAFLAHVAGLSRNAQDALLLLAAAGEAERSVLVEAGASSAALDEAEPVALVTRAGKLEFRHPLLRAAVYGEAQPTARRKAHRALAVVTDGARCAWHLAEGVAGPDDAVAEALEAAAADARAVGGFAAAAQALERSATLTPEADAQARRLLAGAQAWLRAGRIERAGAILERALPLARDVVTRGQIQLERATMLSRGGAMDEAYDLLLGEVERVIPASPKHAAQMLAQAAFVVRLDRADIPTAIELASRAVSLAGSDGDRAELEAVNTLVGERSSANVPPDEVDARLVARAVELLEDVDLRTGHHEAHWIAYCLAEHERDDAARRLSDRSLAEARSAGDVWSLCFGLYARAALEKTCGRVDVARTWAADAVPLAEEMGESWRLAEAYWVLAEVEGVRGNVEACRQALEASEVHLVKPESREFQSAAALGPAHLAAGLVEESIPFLETMLRHVRNGVTRAWFWHAPLDLAEAYLHVGRRRDAESLIREVAPGIERCVLVRPKARLARVKGLVVSEVEVDAMFAKALSFLEEVPHLLERARAELSWGERLSGIGRSADASPHLEHALVRFDALSAVGWAARTRRAIELVTGSSRPTQARRSDELTPQELRVARHAAGGMRDRDIAAALFLSPRTIESHLQHAYRKLGVSNRTQLASVLAADGVRPHVEAADSVTPIP